MVSSETVYKTKKCLVKSGKDKAGKNRAENGKVLCGKYTSTCRRVLECFPQDAPPSGGHPLRAWRTPPMPFRQKRRRIRANVRSTNDTKDKTDATNSASPAAFVASVRLLVLTALPEHDGRNAAGQGRPDAHTRAPRLLTRPRQRFPRIPFLPGRPTRYPRDRSRPSCLSAPG